MIDLSRDKYIMKQTIGTLTYLFFRLSPFILVCFFVLGSVINYEIKGFIYLIGLVFACVVSTWLCPSPDNVNESLICKSFSINGIYDDKTPMSLVIFSYTFFYLVYPIGKYNLASYNVPTLILFPLLILGEIAWIFTHQCFPIGSCVIAIAIGGGIGAAWSAIIDSTRLPALQYFAVGSNRQVCSTASAQKFVCKDQPW